jgi:hypothetical protein
MKKLLWMFPFASALFAAYQPYQVDTFPYVPSAGWNLTGTATGGPAGLNISSSWNSSLISTVPVPDGTA